MKTDPRLEKLEELDSKKPQSGGKLALKKEVVLVLRKVKTGLKAGPADITHCSIAV